MQSEPPPPPPVLDSALEAGDVAFLTVTDVTPIGAFVDWGLPKQLLVPFAEQTRELSVGDRIPVGVYVDNTGRFAGTLKIRELLATDGEFHLDEWVEGEAWRNEPEVGLFVIVERRFLGLVPASEPHTLTRGERANFRIARIHDDGKTELSLRRQVHEQMATDAERVLERLRRDDTPKLSDRADPDLIRALFGLSKKAFKRAVGRLLKDGTVSLDADRNIIPR
ncbi:MAG TPA: S1-like domain-containing RNA-binding protein [Polyangiales bacterium]|nr:S1-like domain-containing RNA-binding protein [Polyangiales bacterium]